MNKKIIAAGGLVQNESKELLMIFRRKKWDLPKGKLDKGETIEACAVREVKEETGLSQVEIIDLIGKTVHEYKDEYSGKEVTKETYWYKMFAPENQPLVPQNEEGIELIEWVNYEQLKEKLKNSFTNIVEIIEKLKA